MLQNNISHLYYNTYLSPDWYHMTDSYISNFNGHSLKEVSEVALLVSVQTKRINKLNSLC